MLSALNPEDLTRHIGHHVVIGTYGGENVTLACEDCHEVLAACDRHHTAAG